MKDPHGATIFQSERALNARRALMMLGVAPEVLEGGTISENVATRVCDFIRELKDHPTNPHSREQAQVTLRTLAAIAGVPMHEGDDKCPGLPRHTAVADMFRDCIEQVYGKEPA